MEEKGILLFQPKVEPGAAQASHAPEVLQPVLADADVVFVRRRGFAAEPWQKWSQNEAKKRAEAKAAGETSSGR